MLPVDEEISRVVVTTIIIRIYALLGVVARRTLGTRKNRNVF